MHERDELAQDVEVEVGHVADADDGDARSYAGESGRRGLPPGCRVGRGRAGGFTMLEVMIALVILGVGILGTTAGQLAAIKLSSDSRIHSEAMNLAEQQLEVFKTMSGPDVDALAGTTVDPRNPIDPALNDATAMALNRSWTIVPDMAGAVVDVGLVPLNVDVTWTNSLGAVSTASVQNLKANL